MGDDAERPESRAGEPKPPKMKAEDNPWYLLATLYGVPDIGDQQLRDKNRIAWNRYFAVNLDQETRAKLIDEKRHPMEELTPFSPEDLQEIERAFSARCKASHKTLPKSTSFVHFENVQFDDPITFEGFLLTDLLL